MKNKIDALRWYDVFIITIVMFGISILSSTLDYIDLMKGVTDVEANLEFTSTDDWFSMLMQVVQLSIVFIYLYLRKFNFKVWKFKINLKYIGCGILIYIVTALLMDVSSLVFRFNQAPLVFTGEFNTIKEFIKEFSYSIVPFSILNGFFEEIFFLGICLNVKKQYINYALIYSLIIRTSFHTYQGIASALTIGFGVGLIFYLVYNKQNKNLTSIMIAHIIADIMGAGLIWFFVY